MDVLVAESERGDADRLIAALQQRGHRVRTCRPDPGSAAPCVGLQRGGVVCPMTTTRFDVLVDVRRRGRRRMSPGESGVFCALYADVPVVVAGVPPPHLPLDWVRAVVPLRPTLDEAVRAVEQAGSRQ